MYQLMKWPPQSRFDLIPTALDPHIKLADEAQRWLNVFPPDEMAEKYRPFLSHLDSIVETTTMPAVQSLVPDTDGAFEATLALFTISAHQYRWKHVPVLPEYREITSLELPPCLKIPLLHMTTLVGLPIAGSVTPLVVYNYDRVTDGARFKFNSISEEVVANEDGWTKLLWTMESTSEPLFQELVKICRILDRKDFANRAEKAEQIALGLSKARDEGSKVFKSLHTFASKGLIKSQYFAPYIEGPHGWGINGIGGASGAQMLPVTSLDALLSIKGESMMYKETVRSREAMTNNMRAFLMYLDAHAEKLRAFAYLDEFSDLISMVYNFRLGHKKLGVKFLAISDGTAGGKIQLQHGEEMVSRFNKEMAARIAENGAYLEDLKELYGPPAPTWQRKGSTLNVSTAVNSRRGSAVPAASNTNLRRGSGMQSSSNTNLSPTGMTRWVSETSMGIASFVGSLVPSIFSNSSVGSSNSKDSSDDTLDEEPEPEPESPASAAATAKIEFEHLIDARLKKNKKLAHELKKSHDILFSTLEAVDAARETVDMYLKESIEALNSTEDLSGVGKSKKPLLKKLSKAASVDSLRAPKINISPPV